MGLSKNSSCLATESLTTRAYGGTCSGTRRAAIPLCRLASVMNANTPYLYDPQPTAQSFMPQQVDSSS